jgi:hypothetical protein
MRQSPQLFGSAAMFIVASMHAASAFSANFSWAGIRPCGRVSPAFTIHDAPKETASLHFMMSDKDAPHFQRQATGGALFDKIEFDRGRSVTCAIRISVRRGEYLPRFRSSRCMMLARCRATRASASLYPIASYGEILVCIPLSLLQMGRVCYSERVQITFGGTPEAARFSLNVRRAQIARCFATECAEGRSHVGLPSVPRKMRQRPAGSLPLGA